MMGLTVAELVATLGLDASEFDRGIDGVTGKAGRASKVLNGVSKAAMAGAVAAGALVVKSLDTYNNFGTAIQTLTRLTGMSSQAASKLTGQWQRFGIDSQSGINATRYLAKNLDTAQQAALKTQTEIAGLDKGSKTYGDSLSKLQVKLIGNEGAFARLGVSIFDAHGKLKSVDTILPLVRNKLSQMDDAGQRTAMTLKLFGRGGAEMLGWLTKTPKEIAAVNKELASLGMVWGGKQVKDWKALKDAQREMGLQWTALQLNLAQTLLPAMKTLMGYVQTGIKDWNELSDGTKGFLLKATAVAGVLGIIGPKALAAGAALKTMFAASAAGGAASGGGSALGGLASGVGANVASTAGTSGLYHMNKAATASASFGGAGVSPVVAIATSGLAAVAAQGLLAAAALGGVIYGADRFANAVGQGVTAEDRAARQRTGSYSKAGSGGESYYKTHIQDTISAAEIAAATIEKTMSQLGANAATATGASFDRIRVKMTQIQTLASAGFEFGDLKADKTDGQLRSLRDKIQGQLGITRKAADRIMASMFKDWRPQPTVMGHLNPAMAAAEARMDKMRANASRQIRFGNVNNTALINAISQVTGAFGSMNSAARTAGDAAVNALSHGSYRGHFAGATGAVVTRPTFALIGESGPEAVVPLNTADGASALGGSSGGGNGGSSSGTRNSITVQVNAPVYGVDDLHAVVYAGTMAAMEEAQVAEGRSTRGMVR